MSLNDVISNAAAILGDQLAGALWYPFDANKRLYFGYVLSTLVLASLIYMYKSHRKGGGGSIKSWWCYLFSSRIWWHSSARLDYQLLIINPLIQFALKGMGAISVVAVAIWISNQLDHQFGSTQSQLPPWLVTAFFTAALFVADDFTRYVLHRLMHRVPCLWALHKLHHSAEVLTPVTVYRIHPLESMLYASRMALTQGIVLGVFFYGFGMRLSAWEIAGANLFTYVFNLAGANLRHSHIRLSYGPWLERLFISPAQHQIHHSDQPKHFDRNFGSCLALWDWWFGSLIVAKNQKYYGFGLGKQQRNPYSTLWQAYWIPLVESSSALIKSCGYKPVKKHPALQKILLVPAHKEEQ